MKINSMLLLILIVSFNLTITRAQYRAEVETISENILKISFGHFLSDSRTKTNSLVFNDSRLIYNISYEFVDQNFEDVSPNIALVNEIGFKNTLLFLQIGPKLIFDKNISTDLYFGAGIIFQKSFLSLYSGSIYLGISPSYRLVISKKMFICIEGGAEFSIEDRFAISTYVLVGYNHTIN